MKGLKLLLDGVFWLAVCLDMVSSLVLLHLGFPELNPLYAYLGNYWFWIVFVCGNFGVYLLFQNSREWYPKYAWWRWTYVILLLPAAGHIVCTLNNIQVI